MITLMWIGVQKCVQNCTKKKKKKKYQESPVSWSYMGWTSHSAVRQYDSNK